MLPSAKLELKANVSLSGSSAKRAFWFVADLETDMRSLWIVQMTLWKIFGVTLHKNMHPTSYLSCLAGCSLKVSTQTHTHTTQNNKTRHGTTQNMTQQYHPATSISIQLNWCKTFWTAAAAALQRQYTIYPLSRLSKCYTAREINLNILVAMLYIYANTTLSIARCSGKVCVFVFVYLRGNIVATD